MLSVKVATLESSLLKRLKQSKVETVEEKTPKRKHRKKYPQVVSCSICQTTLTISPGFLPSHAICHIPAFWECEYCITKTKRKGDLVRHLKIVHKDFTSKPSLSVTMNEHNNVLKEKVIECFPDIFYNFSR